MAEIENTIKKIYKLWKSDPQKFNTLKEAARKHALENYDYSHEFNGFINLIKFVLKDR